MHFKVIFLYIKSFANSSINKECFISNGLQLENVLLLMCRRRRGWRKFRRLGAAQVPTQSHDFQSGATRGARKGVREIALPLRVDAWASRLENVTFGSARSGENPLLADIKNREKRSDATTQGLIRSFIDVGADSAGNGRFVLELPIIRSDHERLLTT